MAGTGVPALQDDGLIRMSKGGNEKKMVSCRAGIPMPAADADAAAPRDRKHLRRLERIFPQIPGPLFFVTCCVSRRRRVLAETRVARILVDAWAAAPDTYGWQVGRYVVMPNHVHFFTGPCRDDAESLSHFVGRWKRWTAREIRNRVVSGFAWQIEFFDHLLRSSESYGAKWEYVRNNPVRAGLVQAAEEWPFQGELSVVQW